MLIKNLYQKLKKKEATSIGRNGLGSVVHIHKGILLSYKKECIWVNSKKVDETRAYYIEWSKLERETAVQYINACIWNLERQ